MATFTLPEARALLPDVRAHTDDVIRVRADLAEARSAQQQGQGPLADLKALEAHLHELLEWYPDQGLELKGFAPVILDFPSMLEGEPVLLCWLEGEHALQWFHRPDHGFLGRRPIPGTA